MSRSKRHEDDATPMNWATYRWRVAEKIELIHAGVFLLLIFNIFAYGLFVSTNRRDKYPRPEMLTCGLRRRFTVWSAPYELRSCP